MKVYIHLILCFLLTFNQALADNIYYNPVQIKNNLTVTGNTSVQGISATATTLTGTVNSSATINSSGTMNQTGPFIASSATTLSGLTTVANTLTSNSTINSNGNFVAAGANTLTGPTTVGNTLTLDSAAPIISTSTASFGSGSVADASSIVDLTSTTKGFLPPRMTLTQRDAIASPATGLTIFNTTTNALNAYNGVAWVGVGSGSGSGRTNNITGDSSDLENTIGNWVTFDDGGSLVDGTGGSPSVITISRNTTMPLQGNGDLKISHSAADGTGEGASLPVTSREADKSRVQEINFEYKTAGNYADDTYEIWVYDISNSALIELSPNKLKASATPSVFKGTFQNSSSSTSYRLIVYTASATNNTSDVYFDNIISGPPIYNYGLVGSDYKGYTPTLNDNTNVATNTATYRRIGDEIEIHGYIEWNGNGSGAALTASLPTGLVIDTSKLVGTLGEHYSAGSFSYLDNGTNYRTGNVSTSGGSNFYFVADSSNNAYANTQFANGDKIGYSVKVPILGWSSNVQLSDDSDLRPIQLINKNTTPTVSAFDGSAKIKWGTPQVDTHAAYNDSTGDWIAPVTGYYHVNACLDLSMSGATAGQRGELLLKVDGTTEGSSYSRAQTTNSSPLQSCINKDIYVPATKAVSLSIDSNYNSVAVDADGNRNYLTIHKIANPSTIAATDEVSAKYTAASLTNSIPNTSAPTIFDAMTKVWDTHGAVTTGSGWQFLAPISGKYEVEMSFLTGGEAWTSGDYLIADVHVNGVSTSQIHWNQRDASATLQVNVHGSTTVKANEGQTISVVLLSSRTGGSITTIEPSNIRNYIMIRKVGGP